MPRVSVIMGTYNGAAHLEQAVGSVLGQSLTDLELIVVDDGSEDSTHEILSRVADRDQRVRWVANDENMGLSYTLNRAITMASGERIARMDHDDSCHRRRLDTQDRFLSANPDLSICGSWVRITGADRGYVLSYPTGRDCVSSSVLFTNPLAHPSVMITRRAIEDPEFRYDESVGAGQDYELWSRMLAKYQADNVPRALIKYRIHEESVTNRDASASWGRRLEIQKRLLENLGAAVEDGSLERHARIGNGDGFRAEEDLQAALDWLQHLLELNNHRGIYSEDSLRAAISFCWYRTCLNSARYVRRAGVLLGELYRSVDYRPLFDERIRFAVDALRARGRS